MFLHVKQFKFSQAFQAACTLNSSLASSSGIRVIQEAISLPDGLAEICVEPCGPRHANNMTGSLWVKRQKTFCDGEAIKKVFCRARSTGHHERGIMRPARSHAS